MYPQMMLTMSRGLFWIHSYGRTTRVLTPMRRAQPGDPSSPGAGVEADATAHSPYTPPIHPLQTPYTPPIRPLYTPYTPHIHPLYIPYTPSIHPLYTTYTPLIHPLYTAPGPAEALPPCP